MPPSSPNSSPSAEGVRDKMVFTHPINSLQWNELDGLCAVLFDMDGVLYDSMPNHALSWHETMKHFGFTLSTDEAYLHEGRTGAGTINIIYRRELGHDATDEQIKEIYGYKSNLFKSLPEPKAMPGARELLDLLMHRGIRPFLVTGSGQKSLLARLEHSFPGVFTPDSMVTAFDVKHGKPDPEPYLTGLKKAFGVDDELARQRAIVVENAPLGILSAKRAGIFTIAVNTGPLPDKVLLDSGADVLFHSMQSLYNTFLDKL